MVVASLSLFRLGDGENYPVCPGRPGVGGACLNLIKKILMILVVGGNNGLIDLIDFWADSPTHPKGDCQQPDRRSEWRTSPYGFVCFPNRCRRAPSRSG